MGLQQFAKQSLKQVPWAWNAYQRAKHQFIRVRTALYYTQDMKRTWRFMYWPAHHQQRWSLSAELLFQYHKLEKGLVMPGKPRLFGTDPVNATMSLLKRWEEGGHDLADPIYRGALSTVHSYERHLTALQLDQQSPAIASVRAFLKAREALVQASAHEYDTPQQLPDLRADAIESFESLSAARRSVRDFLDMPVPLDLVERAVRAASLSPSACNRQPNKVVLIDEPEAISAALALQNGNRGFGHKVPLLALLVVDATGYFDGSERNQPYVDGGLFAMSFMFALRAQGLGSCSLNWCVPPAIDCGFRRLGHIRDEELMVMMLAIGFPPDSTSVPLSPRRAVRAVLRRSSKQPQTISN